MITDIPSPDDFAAYGTAYLNLAWDGALGLLREIEGMGDEEMQSDFWLASQRNLAISVNLCHQAIDFLIKGRIAEVSPYLLFGGDSSSWPKGVDKKDVPFSDFHTLDSQALIRVHDSVCRKRLPAPFIESFEGLRRQRNSLMHTIDKRIALSVKDVIGSILLASETFHGKHQWIKVRKDYLDTSKEAFIYQDGADHIIALEMQAIIDRIGRAELLRFFGFDKKRRRYQCMNCYASDQYVDFENRFAVLEPNSPESTEVYCFVCDTRRSVIRNHCSHEDCSCNVIDAEYKRCLLCDGDQDD
jgi:hypothetical protein